MAPKPMRRTGRLPSRTDSFGMPSGIPGTTVYRDNAGPATTGRCCCNGCAPPRLTPPSLGPAGQGRRLIPKKGLPVQSSPEPNDPSSNSTRARWSSRSRSWPMVFAMVSSISPTVASMMLIRAGARGSSGARSARRRSSAAGRRATYPRLTRIHELTDGLLGDPHTGHEITAAQPRLRRASALTAQTPRWGRSPNPPPRAPRSTGTRSAAVRRGGGAS